MTIYAHIENGTITGRYDTLPVNWRNISNFYTLESETEYLHSLGWRTIIKDTTPLGTNCRYGEPTYAIVDDNVIETIPQIETVDNTIAANIALHVSAMVYLREKRDKLLKDTDFTQLNDIIAINGTELTQAYIVYRQALRDLPNTYENDENFINVDNAVFPIEPPQGV